jgi:hypothetical protein
MKRGDTRTITVDETKIEDAEYLGRGMFCTAYRVLDTVYCFVKDCYMKEAISGIDQPHVPNITRHESTDEFDVYSMPYYGPLRAAHKTAWAQYKMLDRAWDEARYRAYEELKDTSQQFRAEDHNYMVNDCMVETLRSWGADDDLVSAIEQMNYAASNYGSDITYEFGVRNLGVDQDGRLVLRDVLYSPVVVRRVWDEKRKRTNARWLR